MIKADEFNYAIRDLVRNLSWPVMDEGYRNGEREHKTKQQMWRDADSESRRKILDALQSAFPGVSERIPEAMAE